MVTTTSKTTMLLDETETGQQEQNVPLHENMIIPQLCVCLIVRY